jgi:hypothetical protein
MPEPMIQRRFPRYPIQLPFLHSGPASKPARTGVGWTRDLSEGGACVELDERLALPGPVHLHLQTDRGAIQLEAQVVWELERKEGGAEGDGPAEGGILHGVAFTHLTQDQLQTLRTLLFSPGQGTRAGVRLPIDLPVTCQPQAAKGSPIQGRTGDMSRGGLLLRLSQVVPPGTPLEVTLHPPQGRVTAKGEIVWVDPPEKRTPGEPIRHGLRFTALGWARSLSLALLLSEAT